MVIYEVNLEVEAEIAEAFRLWLARHVLEMLDLPGFISAEIAAVEADPNEAFKGRRWSVHYRLLDRQALAEYFEQHSARMRADAQQRFADRFRASRRILSIETLGAST